MRHGGPAEPPSVRGQALLAGPGIGPPAPNPSMVLVTWKLSSIFSVTTLPSAFCTCAS
jgi:hypothetical protein